ncbi:MAG TPA: enoyl-CoA hydratase/isomerase family protein [bacterium]|nr:enoyl-CoA hydratase/isomerase family protein [bacterium]
MPVIRWEKVDSVANVIMDQGENRHNPEFIADFLRVFDEVEADNSIRALVLSSSDPKTWSQGIDLNWVMSILGDEVKREQLKGFLSGLNDMFIKMLTFPMPVIAAISGHTFGDGAIMACACDFRFMRADRGFFCFPEVDLNIPFLPGMLAIVRRAFPYYKLEEMIFTGKRVGAQEMAEHHAIVKACPDLESLQTEVMAFAKSFQKERGIFRELKKRMHKEIIEIMEKEDPPYINSMQLLA